MRCVGDIKMKLNIINTKSDIIHEGISIDYDTEDIRFDFQNDNKDDIVKFFDDIPLVHDIGSGIYVGFIFTEMSPEMQGHEREKIAISLARSYKSFRSGYKKFIDPYTQRTISGIEIEDNFVTALRNFNPYIQLKKMLGNKIDDAIKSGGANVILVMNNILNLIDEKYDADLIMQYVRGSIEIPKRNATAASTRITDLKSSYERAKSKIIRALNRGTTGDEDIENFMYFAAERLLSFDGFGFTPDAIVRPHTGSNLLINFVDMVAYEMGVPAIEGLVKSNVNVTYNDDDRTIVLINSSGQVNQDLDNEKWIGRGVTIKSMANKIVNDNFKITHLYPQNRNNLQGLFKSMPEMTKLLSEKPNPNVLLVDDSIFSGATQREMMMVMKQLQIGNIASYAIVKA